MANRAAPGGTPYPKIASDIGQGADAAAAVTIAAVTGEYHLIDWVAWSYGEAPTGGSVTIDFGGTDFVVDITAAGPGILNFGKPIVCPISTPVTITLSAGGGTVAGKINVGYR